MSDFDLNEKERKFFVNQILSLLEPFYQNTKEYNVSSSWDVDEIRKLAQSIEFTKPNNGAVVLKKVIDGLKKYTVHTTHPNYYGLFNPRAGFVSAIADFVVAVMNPQLAAWSHAPYANEIEKYVIQEFGKKFGYEASCVDGTFCSGGAESNLTAVFCALNQKFPDVKRIGVIGLNMAPVIYCSAESHHSISRASRVVGLGENAISLIPTHKDLRMNIKVLEEKINVDIQGGKVPLMVVGTAGTTGAGSIDDLEAISEVSRKYNLWFHADAAYGGAVSILDSKKKWLKGIEKSNSITLDVHKWFSVPMGASLFITKNPKVLNNSFGLSTNYMPEKGNPNEIADPYVHSIQWSRRFIGLKIYLPLAVFGWQGFEKNIAHQIEMGNQLRELLLKSGWIIKNSSVLPIVCFTHKRLNNSNEKTKLMVDWITSSGKAWVSVYPINGLNTVRACITNYSTALINLNELMDTLNSALDQVS